MKRKILFISTIAFSLVTFFWTSCKVALAAEPIAIDWSTIGEFGLPDPGNDGVYVVLDNFLNWLLGIIGLIALIAFIVSGIQYLLASGDERIIETAKRNMKYSILGVIVALSGFVIIQAVDLALRANSFKF